MIPFLLFIDVFLWHAQSSSELDKMVPLPVTRPNNTGHSTLAYSCVAIHMKELTSVLILLSLVGKPRISFFLFFISPSFVLHGFMKEPQGNSPT